MPTFKAFDTISEGTLRTADLLFAFNWALADTPCAGDADLVALRAEAAKCAQEINDGREENEDDIEILAELENALNDAAPEYCYFGAHEGDGACFGFWPSMTTATSIA